MVISPSRNSGRCTYMCMSGIWSSNITWGWHRNSLEMMMARLMISTTHPWNYKLTDVMVEWVNVCSDQRDEKVKIKMWTLRHNILSWRTGWWIHTPPNTTLTLISLSNISAPYRTFASLSAINFGMGMQYKNGNTLHLNILTLDNPSKVGLKKTRDDERAIFTVL